MQVEILQNQYTGYGVPAAAALYGTFLGARSSFSTAPANGTFDSLQLSGFAAGDAENGETAMNAKVVFKKNFSSQPGVEGAAGTGAVECQTCSSRRYQDGSDDASVSFQSPTAIKPSQAAAAVMSHEMEHVNNERVYAERDNRKILFQSVTIHRDICPECGTVYVAGGETKTVSRGKAEKAYTDSLTIANQAKNTPQKAGGKSKDV